MKRILVTMVLILAFCSASTWALAADMSDNWAGQLDGDSYPISYSFRLDHGSLTGSTTSPQGAAEISNVNLSHNAFSFSIDADGIDIPHRGIYDPSSDTISMKIDYPPESFIATSGGIFRDIMVHDIDLAVFLSGEIPSEVWATGALHFSNAFAAASDFDTAAVIMKTPSGVIITQTLSSQHALRPPQVHRPMSSSSTI